MAPGMMGVRKEDSHRRHYLDGNGTQMPANAAWVGKHYMVQIFFGYKYSSTRLGTEYSLLAKSSYFPLATAEVSVSSFEYFTQVLAI